MKQLGLELARLGKQRINILSLFEAGTPASSFRSAAKLLCASETPNVKKPSWANRSVGNL